MRRDFALPPLNGCTTIIGARQLKHKSAVPASESEFWRRDRRYSGSMTKREQQAAAAILERLAVLVDRGEVMAAAGFLGRLQGAVVALRLLGGPEAPPDSRHGQASAGSVR